MAHTRGAAKKAVDDPAEDVPAADQNKNPPVTEKSAPTPRRTRSRRGKKTVEEQQETDEQEAINGDAVTAEAEEEGEAAEEGEADGTVGKHEGQSGRASRSGKGRGRKDMEKPKEAQLVSFPSIMDESVNNTGTIVPFPEPYVPKPRYTPVIPATPKGPMPSVPLKTPKFDPEVHGKDLEKDLQEDSGIDTFEQFIKRSPKKRRMDNKSLNAPTPLDLEAVQVTEIQLPDQTEERKMLSEKPARTEEPVQTAESIPKVKELDAAGASKGRVTRKNAPFVQAIPLTVKKTRAEASASSTANPVTTAIARRGKQPEPVKTTSPPTSPLKAASKKTAPLSPPRADSKKPITSSTPSKALVTPPRAEAKGNTTPTRTVLKSVTTSPPRTEKKKPALVNPLRSPVTKNTSTGSPRPSAEKPISPKSVLKPTALVSPPWTSSKQPTPSSSPRATGKRSTSTSSPRADAKKAPPVSQTREVAKRSAERPIAKAVPRKPLGSAAPKAPPREKKSVVEPPPVNELLPIRVKRVASGPVPPTKRIRPTPPMPGAAAESSQNTNMAAPPTPCPRIASLNKPPPAARASKAPTKPTGFRFVGEDVARKQAEAKEARKKRMEEAEAVRTSLKEKEAKARKSIPSKTSSVASKSSRDSNVSAAVIGQLERELASVEAKKAEESTKAKALSPPRLGQSRPVKPPAIVPRPPLVIQKKAPTAKITAAASKPAVPAVARGAAGPASGIVNGTAQLTPEQEDMQRKERIAHAEKLRKQAAESGKAAIFAWAAQKNKQAATSPSSTTETK